MDHDIYIRPSKEGKWRARLEAKVSPCTSTVSVTHAGPRSL